MDRTEGTGGMGVYYGLVEPKVVAGVDQYGYDKQSSDNYYTDEADGRHCGGRDECEGAVADNKLDNVELCSTFETGDWGDWLG